MFDDRAKTKKKILDSAIEKRRDLQSNILFEWDKGKLTHRQCIERILDLEKIISIDTSILRNKEEDEGENNG